MVVSGDWLTPRLNGYKYFEKPALQYWITAAAFTAFGQNEWAARLWPGLTGFLGVLLVFWAGRRLFAPPAALCGAAVAAGSTLYVVVGHILTLDMALTFFMSASVFAFAVAQGDAEESRRRRWMLVAWASAALAVMTKGLVGIVLPAGAVAAYVVLHRDWGLLPRLYLIRGGLLFLAIVAPWFILVSLANPEFFRFFFIHEHFERFLTREHDRYQPLWFFLPVLLGGMLPWAVAAGLSLAAAGIVSAGFSLARRLLPATISLAFGGFLFADVALTGHERLSPAFSAYHIVHQIRDQLKPDVPFYVVKTFDHTLLFYLSRTVTMVGNKDELAASITWDPRDFL